MSMKHCIIALGTLATIALASSAHAQTSRLRPFRRRSRLQAPNQVFLIGHAIGTQNYECQPVASVGRVGWVLFTPQATLFGELDEQLTTHFFSPNPAEGRVVRATWQDSQDTSTVWARATGSAVVDADAIPWVRLQKSRHAGGTDRGHDSRRHHLHPAGEHRRRPGAGDRV